MESLIYLLIALQGAHIVYSIFSSKVLTLEKIGRRIALWEWISVFLAVGAIMALFGDLPWKSCCRVFCLLAVIGVLQKKAADNLYSNLILWLKDNPFGVFVATGRTKNAPQFGRVMIYGMNMNATVIGEPLPENLGVPVGVYIRLGRDANPEGIEVYPIVENAEEAEIPLPEN